MLLKRISLQIDNHIINCINHRMCILNGNGKCTYFPKKVNFKNLPTTWRHQRLDGGILHVLYITKDYTRLTIICNVFFLYPNLNTLWKINIIFFSNSVGYGIVSWIICLLKERHYHLYLFCRTITPISLFLKTLCYFYIKQCMFLQNKLTIIYDSFSDINSRNYVLFYLNNNRTRQGNVRSLFCLLNDDS